MSNDPKRAGAPEVEITPEMIEAAETAFYDYTFRMDYRSVDELREDVFALMLTAALRKMRAT